MAKTVMLIDDSLTLRQMLKITLRKDGYEILEAENGVDALEKVKGQKINLFICDLNMPKMNGIEFIKTVKQDKNFAYTPVIMLTTEPKESIKEDAKEIGIKIWKVKPFDPVDIVMAVKKLIGE